MPQEHEITLTAVLDNQYFSDSDSPTSLENLHVEWDLYLQKDKSADPLQPMVIHKLFWNIKE